MLSLLQQPNLSFRLARERRAKSILTTSMNVSTPVVTTIIWLCLRSVSHACGDLISEGS